MHRLVLVLLAAGMLAPGAAAARTRSLPDGRGARAVVGERPFRLGFTSPDGTPRLRSVAPGAAASLRIPARRERLYGTQAPPRPALYAPVSFLVGSRRIAATPSTQWQGTLRSVTSAGVEYRSTRVLDARRRRGGLDLTVATTDPTGRRLAVRVAALRGGGFRVRVRPTPGTGVAAMAQSFVSRPGEAFRGFGGRHDGLDQRGRAFWNWIAQEGLASSSTAAPVRPTDPGDPYLFPSGPPAAYDVASSLTSSRGFALLLDRDAPSQWRMASDRRDAWRVDATGRRLDTVVIPDGRPARAARRLTARTGRQPAPPAWALGTIFDRAVAFPSETAGRYLGEVRSDLAAFDRYGVHVDAYRIEGWELLPRAALRRLIARLRRRGIHPMLYFRAFVGTDPTGTDSPGRFAEAIRKGYVATRADGRPYVFEANFNAPTALIDFTDPAARRWWRGRITEALELGADGFMADFGEQVMPGMRFADGSTGVTMHNRYPVLSHRATRAAVAAFERAHPRRHVFFFTRAGYSGTPGSAAFEHANFPGDETTDWTRASGLASQAPDMLNRAIGGQWGFTTDIGGYFDLYGPTSKELFVRWAQWAALSPFFRLHGGLLGGVHTPWSYDRRTVRLYTRLARLHGRARPLIARLWRQAERTGRPITRPLWTVAPRSPAAARQDQEWLLGPDVLVAPVVTEGATTRRVWFPPGCWRGGGRRHRGPGSATVAAPLTTLPWFVRCGTDPL